MRGLFTLLLGIGLVYLTLRVIGAPGGLDTAAAQPPAGLRVDAPGTGPSACLAYAPTGASRKRTVFLDPGHGGPDPGASGRAPSGAAVLEKDQTLAVARLLATRLRQDGYRVVLARSQDTLVAAGLGGSAVSAADERRDLQARIDCANAARADVLLSIHFNGFGDPSAGGTETFYDTARPFAAQNLRLARSVQAALVAALRLQNRGVLADDQLDTPTLTDAGATYGHLVQLGPPRPGLVSRASAMPGVLTEPLFVTAPSEAAIVTSANGRQRIADALASGLEGFLR